jgi:hypothetical protein
LADGTRVSLPDKNWTVLVSAGLSEERTLRVMRRTDGQRVLVYGQAGKLVHGELAPGLALADIEGSLRRVCEHVDLPLDLVYSCLRRLPARA